MKQWLMVFLIACQLFGCSVNDGNNESLTITPELTVIPTATAIPAPTPLSTFDPYDVYLRHSPLDVMNFLIPLDGNKFYQPSETVNEKLLLITVYDFDNWIVERRTYKFEDKIDTSSETLNNSDYIVTLRYNYLLSTVDTYQNPNSYTSTYRCHIDYENSEYNPQSTECALTYELEKNFKVFFIVNAVISHELGDTTEDAASLYEALENNPELQDEYIKLIFDFFKEK